MLTIKQSHDNMRFMKYKLTKEQSELINNPSVQSVLYDTNLLPEVLWTWRDNDEHYADKYFDQDWNRMLLVAQVVEIAEDMANKADDMVEEMSVKLGEAVDGMKSALDMNAVLLAEKLHGRC